MQIIIPIFPGIIAGKGDFFVEIAFFDAKPYERESFSPVAAERGITIRYFETRLTPETATLARGSEAACTFVNDTVDAAVIDALRQNGVDLLALRCAGYNQVDLRYAFGRLHVLHVPAYSPHAVAEHAMGMLLTSVRRIHKAYNRTRDFNFSLRGLTGFELYGKTAGVIGTGRIGRAFLEICRGFGMRTVAYDPFPAADGNIHYVTLPELFAQSDVISLHCPLTEETRHIISGETLPLLKEGVVLINTSRGGLIDTAALLRGIKERKIGAACLDVYEEESDVFFEDRSGHILSDDALARLISMPNVLLTSHQAFLTREALHSIAQTTLQNVMEFRETGHSDNELCYRCGKIDTCRAHRCEKCF